MLQSKETISILRRAASTGLVYEEGFLRHDPGPNHPESPHRLAAIMASLSGRSMLENLRLLAPIEPEMEWLKLVHQPWYIRTAHTDITAGRPELSTGDTAVCRRSYEVALRAVGGVLAAVDAVMEGQVRTAFCAVRPPGHHATASCGMGFCIFNNVAVGARYAQRTWGVGKVLIIDWDAHHGNGTQEIFYEDGSVYYFSVHQDGLYPMPVTGLGHAHERGRGAGAGANLNIPLPGGSGDREVLAAFRDVFLPEARRFGPELVFISAGFDGRQGDPLGSLQLTDGAYAELTRLAVRLSQGGRVISVLEGGYNLDGLASAAACHVQALMDVP